jgi:hypothetical protein
MQHQLLLLAPRPAPADVLARVRATLERAKARATERHGSGLTLFRPIRIPGEVPLVQLRRRDEVVVECARPVGPRRIQVFDTKACLQQEAREWWALGSHKDGCRGCGSTSVAPMRLCELCARREAEPPLGIRLDPGLFDGE